METETNNPNQTEYAEFARDKAELMTRIQHEWAALQQAIGQLNSEQMSKLDAGGWSIKDNLAHLTVWETVMRLAHLQNRPTYAVLHIDQQTFDQLDENGLNRVLLQRHRARSVADVLADMESTHAQALADLEQWSYADLMQPHYPDDPEERPLIGWVIGNTYEHYQEHRLTIQKFIEQVKSA